jgi:hypothetical protein
MMTNEGLENNINKLSAKFFEVIVMSFTGQQGCCGRDPVAKKSTLAITTCNNHCDSKQLPSRLIDFTRENEYFITLDIQPV